MERFKTFIAQVDEAKAGETCSCCDNEIDKNGKCGCGPDCEHCGGQHDVSEAYRAPTKAEIEADKRKDNAGKKRPSMDSKSANKAMYKNMMGGLKKEETELDEAAPKINKGKAKGSISATGLRGKGMKKFDVNVAVQNGKFEFRITDETGRFQTVGIKQAAKMLGEEVFAMDIDYNDEKSLARAAKSAGITAKFVQAGGATEMQLKGDKNKITKFLKARKVPASEISRGWFKEEVELDEAMDQKKFSAGAKAIKAYAQKNGGVDKKDFMEVSKLLDQIGRVNILQAGQLLSRLNRLVDGQDTDVRERIFVELKKVGLVESVNEAVGTSAKHAGKTGMFGGKYTSKDRMLDMKNFTKIRDKKHKQRDAEHAKQDPKMRKMGYAKHMLDTDKADAKARKRGIDPAGKYDKYKKKNGIREELDEATINAIAAEYINEHNISMAELEAMSPEQLDEIIGKAIGGAFKIGAKAAVGSARLAKKAANRMSTSGRANAAEKKADSMEKKNRDRDRIKAAQDRLRKAKEAARNK